MKAKLSIHFRDEWFLFLCPAFICVHGFSRFPEAIHWVDIVILFLQYSFCAFLLSLVFSLLLPFRKAALFVTSLVLFNIVYGSLQEAFLNEKEAGFLGRFSFVFPFFLVVFSLFFFWLRRGRSKLLKLGGFLNFLFLVFIVMDVFQYYQKIAKRDSQLISTAVCRECPKPDVYLVVTDGYAGQPQLHGLFGFDNCLFLDSLRTRGFHIVDSSVSNYSATKPSMTALLNMDFAHLDEEDNHLFLNKNSVIRFFQASGYEIVNNSIFKVADQFPHMPTTYFKTGTKLITKNTFVSHFEEVVHNLLFTFRVGIEIDRVERIEENTRQLEIDRDSITMARLLESVKGKVTSPRFVYTHFNMPHPPYLFNATGQLTDTSASEKDQYLGFLQFTNGKLLQAVDSILTLSARLPVILLLSDHGYRDDNDPNPTPLRFYNLAAVYLPGKQYTPYYKGLSNVNQFRILLNTEFGQQLPLLTDSTVY